MDYKLIFIGLGVLTILILFILKVRKETERLGLGKKG